MTLKVEVGKKYQHNVTKSIFTCVALNQTQVVFEGTAGFTTFWWTEMYKFSEYKELIKHVRYFAIRKDGIVGPYTKNPGKETWITNLPVLGVQRVEFVEGTWDD